MEEKIIQRAIELIDNTPVEVIDRIGNFSKKIREEAVAILIKPLNKSSQEDLAILNNIPLYLSETVGHSIALSFIETIISNGHYISLEVIEEVYKSTVNEIDMPEVRNDLEFMKEINKKIQLLINATQKNPLYKENPDFIIFLGKEYERNLEIDKAITKYNQLIELGDERGYLHLALAYKQLGENDFAINLLEQGWNIYSTNIFLENIIIIFLELGKINDAKRVYSKLISGHYADVSASPQGNIYPFIMYSFSIEKDEDLYEFEKQISGYIGENILTPISSLFKLSLVVDSYIEENLSIINDKLIHYHSVGLDKLTNDEITEYKDIILKRLYLMQVHIYTLKNDKYLESHMEDINTLTFGGDEDKLELLRQHFENHYPYDILHELFSNEKDDNLEKEDGYNNEELDDGNDSNSVYHYLSIYLENISMMFFHGEKYNVLLKHIYPILSKCYAIIDIDNGIDDLQGSLNILKDETDYIDTFRPIIKELYFDFIEYIDNS